MPSSGTEPGPPQLRSNQSAWRILSGAGEIVSATRSFHYMRERLRSKAWRIVSVLEESPRSQCRINAMIAIGYLSGLARQARRPVLSIRFAHLDFRARADQH